MHDSFTKEDVAKKIKEEGVKFIGLQFTDILGNCKNVSVTERQIQKALENKCMFDGSSIEGFARIEESDMYLVPDLSTFMICPLVSGTDREARIICDIYKPDYTPFEGAPRFVLRRVINEARKMGFDINVGAECEFFLFQTDQACKPTVKTIDQGSYFELGPTDKGECARRDICLMLENMGFEIEASHHECAPGQHEIDFKYSNAMRAADNIVNFKLAVKSIADRHGLYATFMPKPLYNEAGSGMHINISLEKNGENVFFEPENKFNLSKLAYNFIAGVMNHAKGMTCITNPIVNSYKRLVPGYEAPVHIAWSTQNRSPLIRVPTAQGSSMRIEVRSPDPTANPYLALAVCIAAGIDGVKLNMMPPAAMDNNIFNLPERAKEKMNIEKIPETLGKAIEELRKDELLKSVLGESLLDKYIKCKESDWLEYRYIVTEWELNKYLSRY